MEYLPNLLWRRLRKLYRLNVSGAILKASIDIVTQFKVAAMELPQFLDRIEEGNLIITRGTDRISLWGASRPKFPHRTLILRDCFLPVDSSLLLRSRPSRRAWKIFCSDTVCRNGYVHDRTNVSSVTGTWSLRTPEKWRGPGNSRGECEIR